MTHDQLECLLHGRPEVGPLPRSSTPPLPLKVGRFKGYCAECGLMLMISDKACPSCGHVGRATKTRKVT
jgi:hypothetical protein